MTFADPFRTVPEAARLLRPGGLFAFSSFTPLKANYFEQHRDDDGESVVFTLPYGKWIELFRDSCFDVESLVELRPPENAKTTYNDFVTYEWARKWPAEQVWRLRLGTVRH